MSPTEKQAVLTVALLAAFADGRNADAEREEVRRVAESLQGEDDGSLNAAALVQEVLLKRVTVADVAARLGSAEMRQLAYELAVGVCDADGLRNDDETRFLAELGSALGLAQPKMAETAAAADALVTAPLEEVPAAAPAPAALSTAGLPLQG